MTTAWRQLAADADAAAAEWEAAAKTTPPGSTPDPTRAAELCRSYAADYREQARRT
jgi:hypothetical protein